MIQTESMLESLKKEMEQLLARDGRKYQCPLPDNKADRYELVLPSVYIGLIPPGCTLTPGAGPRIPCLVAGMLEDDSTSEATIIQLQITAVVYDPGIQEYDESGKFLKLQANFDGFLTLINLLDCVKAEILRNDGITGRYTLEGAVKLRTYEEQPWPYWYGYLQFSVSGEPYPQTKYAQALR